LSAVRGGHEPNAHYTANGYHYETDAQRRITHVEGELCLEPDTPHNKYTQGEAGKPDRLQTDAGGHLIARMFGGAPGFENLVAMDKHFNGGGGDWGKLQKTWQRALDPAQAGGAKSVAVDIRPEYGAGNSLRPEAFRVSYRIGNADPVEVFFENRAR
jgi:DNA/RNA non-specific endonuclease